MEEYSQNQTESFQNFLKGHGNEKPSEFLLIILPFSVFHKIFRNEYCDFRITSVADLLQYFKYQSISNYHNI